MKGPHVTIIIVNYFNYTETITCAKRLLRQQYPNFDIVIVDNNSPNDSYSILRKTFETSDKVTVIKTEKNLGYGGGNNYGIRWKLNHGDVDYFFIVNNDIVIEDSRLLEKLVTFAESVSDLAAVSPKVILPNGYIQGPYEKPSPFILILQYLIPVVWLLLRYLRQIKIRNLKRPCRVYRTIGACMLVRANLLVSVGGFDEELFMQGEENILAEKFIRAGFHFYYYPLATVLHNHRASATATLGLKRQMLMLGIENMAIYFKKYRNEPEWLIQLYKFAAKWYLLCFYNVLEFIQKAR